ncbi:hypothetical protein GCM10028803_04990 [Larkinella knui]|uniref:hypothetical protein n=1 Tax=Larkinella knui TaxID=2025310 RepID=UPI00163A817F|nr:hypothetical protein [Larkinella knui]
MNGYSVEIATHAHFALVWEFELKAASMDEAAFLAEAWMEDNGFSLCYFTYVIEQIN